MKLPAKHADTTMTRQRMPDSFNIAASSLRLSESARMPLFEIIAPSSRPPCDDTARNNTSSGSITLANASSAYRNPACDASG